jgi:UDP-glucose:(heptosyl)LPS alpha-1,3-glucosyltransferase
LRLALVHHQFITRGGLEGYLRELLSQFRSSGDEVVLVGSLIDDAFTQAASEVVTISPPRFGRGRLVAKFAEKSAQLVPSLSVDATLGFGRTWKQDIHRAGGGCHAVYSNTLPWHKRVSPKNQMELAIERKLYTSGETKRFVVNSPLVGQEIQDHYGVSPERISVIATGVDTQHWKPAAEPKAAIRQRILPELTDPETKRVLLFVSLDHRRKGLEPLLRAMSQLPDETVLWIVGQGLSRDYHKLIHRLGLNGRVWGFGRQSDLRPFYQAADVFVHPSGYDACANTVLQSMASGVPGLISINDGAHFHIREAENGYVLRQPNSPEAIEDAIREILTADLAKLGQAARETMLPITWAAHLAAWRALLAS